MIYARSADRTETYILCCFKSKFSQWTTWNGEAFDDPMPLFPRVIRQNRQRSITRTRENRGVSRGVGSTQKNEALIYLCNLSESRLNKIFGIYF